MAFSPETLAPAGLSFLRKEPRSFLALCVTHRFLGILTGCPKIRKCAQCLLVLIVLLSVPVFSASDDADDDDAISNHCLLDARYWVNAL